VENFQSHEHSELEFSSGLNVIVGPSDYGKSALVRALRWLFYNEPRGADFIRVGANECRVTVELDDGTKISRIRGSSGRNRYLLQRPGEREQVFEGFGSEVPAEIVEASGMRKVFIDDRHKVELNFGGQLEGPFLLAENAAVRAKMIGQLGGVHILDTAQKSVASDLRRMRSEESQLAQEIEKVREALQAYDHLPQLEEKISILEETILKVEELEKDLAVLSELEAQWKFQELELERLQVLLEQLVGVEEIEKLVGQLESLLSRFRDLRQLAQELAEVEDRLKAVELVLRETEQVSTAEKITEEVEEQFWKWKELGDVAKELALIERKLQVTEKVVGRTEVLPEVEKIVSRCEEQAGKLLIFEELYKEWQSWQSSYQGVCAAAARYQKEIDEKLAEFQDLLIRLGKCPVCFGEITSEAVARILAEFQ